MFHFHDFLGGRVSNNQQIDKFQSPPLLQALKVVCSLPQMFRNHLIQIAFSVGHAKQSKHSYELFQSCMLLADVAFL